MTEIRSTNFVVNFFLKCMFHHGLLDRVAKNKIRKRAWVILVLVNLYSLNKICLFIYTTYHYENLRFLLFQLTDAIEIVKITYLINASIFNGKLISRLLKIISNTQLTTSIVGRSILYYQVAIIVTGYVRVVFEMLKPFWDEEKYLTEYVTAFLYDFAFVKSRLKLAAFMLTLNKGFYYNIKMVGLYYQAVFYFALESLRIRGLQVAQIVSNPKSNLHEFKVNHTELMADVHKLDNLMKWLLAIWLAEWTGSCYYEMRYIKLIENYGVAIILCSVVSLSSIFIVLFTTSMISESNSVLMAAGHLRSVAVDHVNSKEKQMTELFLREKIRTAILHFTLFKGVVLNRGFVGGLFLAVASYGTFVWSMLYDVKNSDLNLSDNLNCNCSRF